MEFKFYCPHCGQHIAVTDDLVGTKGSCPNCQCTIVVPSVAHPPQSVSPPSISPPPSGASIRQPPPTATAPNLCPFCRKEIDRLSTVCPHCTKNVGMVNLQRREPQAYASGMVCAFLTLPLAYFIHKKLIDDCFEASGCCLYMVIVPILIFLGYGTAGFWIGFTVRKLLRR